MENQITETILNSGLLAAFLAIVIALINLGSTWLRAQTEKIKNEKIRGALLQVEDAVAAAVAQTAQQEADALKEASVDGKLTEEEKQELARIAKERATVFISKDVADLAQQGVDNLSAYMDALIEKHVRAFKVK